MTHQWRSLSGLLDCEGAARWGSFKLAAHELHKTAAPVSQPVKRLEDSVGFSLFIRHPRHIALTAKDQDLASRVSQLVEEFRTEVTGRQVWEEERILRSSARHTFGIKLL